MMGAGALAVLLFSSAQTVLWRRLLAGVLALTRLPTAFGDVCPSSVAMPCRSQRSAALRLPAQSASFASLQHNHA